jgi:hypothetical protein
MNTTNLNNDQRQLINMYMNQYNQANAQIDRLYGVLDEIRYNIAVISQQPGQQSQSQSTPQSTRHQSTRHQQPRNLNRTNTNTNILYDYQNPINPSIYLNRSSTRNRSSNNESFSSQISSLLSSFLNTSVTVRASAEQLESGSRLVRYGDITRPLSETCPISMERFSIDDQVRQIHQCGHIFMPSEFDEWFQSNVRCPVCRFDIRNHTTSNTGTSTRGDTGSPGLQGATGTTGGTSRVLGLQGATGTTGVTGATGANSSATNNALVRNITDSEISDNILNTLSSRLLESILYPSSNINNDDRFVFDPSNNILMYETTIRNPNARTENNSDSDQANN